MDSGLFCLLMQYELRLLQADLGKAFGLPVDSIGPIVPALDRIDTQNLALFRQEVADGWRLTADGFVRKAAQ